MAKMLVYRLRGGRSNSVGVLPNLRSDVEQRDHDRDCANHLSDVSEIVEIHVSQLVVVGQALRLPKPKMATDAVALQFQLAIVIRGVEIAS